jgi:hypothetical protein
MPKYLQRLKELASTKKGPSASLLNAREWDGHGMLTIPSDVAERHNSLRVELVTSMNQFVHVLAIRAVCYTEDVNTALPFDDAFDGNDFQASHIVAYMGDEPIGALRIRWFSNFAKIERTGFRPAYRNPRYLQRAAPFVFNHIARKGYSRAITHAAPKYAAIWRRFLGFKPVEKPDGLYQEGHYVELVKELEVPTNVITADSSINTLFRTEGAWDAPNKYEVMT